MNRHGLQNRYDLLLADADGTLLDFHLAEGKALRHACGAMGIAIDDQRDALYRQVNAEVWRAYERNEITQDALRVLRFSRFAEALGLAVDVEAMADAFITGLSLQADEMDGARGFLEQASALGIKTVIVTNGIAAVQRSRFALSPLSRWISGLVISGELGFAKPDPRMIEKGLEAAGCPAGKALMLGDEPRADIAAANAAGVDSCWFNPAGRKNPTEHRPTYEIRTLQEALQILRGPAA